MPVHESTKDSWRDGLRGSLELGCAAAPGHGFSSWLHEEGEERSLVLTVGETGRRGEGGELATVNGDGGRGFSSRW
jgi:hypothetical protein